MITSEQAKEYTKIYAELFNTCYNELNTSNFFRDYNLGFTKSVEATMTVLDQILNNPSALSNHLEYDPSIGGHKLVCPTPEEFIKQNKPEVTEENKEK